jgi:hypothetical protein
MMMSGLVVLVVRKGSVRRRGCMSWQRGTNKMRSHVIVASQREAMVHVRRPFEVGLMQGKSEVEWSEVR